MKGTSGGYCIAVDIASEFTLNNCSRTNGTVNFEHGYGCVLDSEGNIIVGHEREDGGILGFNVESFGGKNADVAFFTNVFKD